MLYCIAKPPETKKVSAPSDEEYAAIEREEVALYGVVLGDETVQRALDPSFFSLFSEEGQKGGKTDRRNRKRLTMSQSELEGLREAVHGKITSMAESLLTGDVRTLADGGAEPDCEFCPYGSVCRLPLTEKKQKNAEERTDAEENANG